MPDLSVIPEFVRYAKDATATIANRRDRLASQAEIYANALDRYDDAIGEMRQRAASSGDEGAVASGLSHDRAVAAALAGLGDPGDIRSALSRASRSKLTGGSVAAIVASAAVVTIVIVGLLLWWLYSQGAYTFS